MKVPMVIKFFIFIRKISFALVFLMKRTLAAAAFFIQKYQTHPLEKYSIFFKFI